jgi:hypothetical protein
VSLNVIPADDICWMGDSSGKPNSWTGGRGTRGNVTTLACRSTSRGKQPDRRSNPSEQELVDPLTNAGNSCADPLLPRSSS